MNVLVSGPFSTASTWAFNVIARIFSLFPEERTFALVADDAHQVLANAPDQFDNLIIKAHFLDRNLIELLRRQETRIVFTSRDPADIIVSYQRRFNHDFHDIVRGIARSVSAVVEARSYIPILNLKYEDGFTSIRTTLDDIVGFLHRKVSSQDMDAIFESHKSENLRKTLPSQQSDIETSSAHFPDHRTQWHLDHIGDGRVGKGKESLPPALLESLSNAFPAYETPASACKGEKGESVPGRDVAIPPRDGAKNGVRWTANLFSYDDGYKDDLERLISCDGTEKFVVYGPYLYVQSGIWRADFKINAIPSSPPLRLRIDVVDGSQVAAKMIVVNSGAAFQATLEFDHIDHSTPLEVRIISVADGRTGHFQFSGAELTWVASSPHAHQMSMAVRV